MSTSNKHSKHNSSDSSCDDNVQHKPIESNANTIRLVQPTIRPLTIPPTNNIKKPQPTQSNHPIRQCLNQNSNVGPIPEYILTHLNATAEQMNKTQYMLNNAFIMLASLQNNRNQPNQNNYNNQSFNNNLNQCNQMNRTNQPIRPNQIDSHQISRTNIQFRPSTPEYGSNFFPKPQ